jgi:hypothetical protein
MTESRWELVIVVLVPSATFWSVRHFVAQLLGWGAGSCIERCKT